METDFGLDGFVYFDSLTLVGFRFSNRTLLNFFSRFKLDNNMDGFYIAPSFMDKLVVHITKNFLNLPNIKVGNRMI